MEELEYYFFDNLYTAKRLWDTGVSDHFMERCGSMPADTDEYYEIFWTGMVSVFEDSRNYYNDEKEIETLVCFDPLIDEYFRLCVQYEAQKGISKEANPYRGPAQRAICESFGFMDYSADWWLCDEQHGRPHIVVLMACEFCSHHALPAGLANAREELVERTDQLTRELKALTAKKPKQKAKPTPKLIAQAELKEAA